jgi:site-specific recombinase XerC
MTWLGRRDYTLLLLAAQTGLRLSELISLDRDAVRPGAGAHVRCVGKGRKERCTPLTAHARSALQTWLKDTCLARSDWTLSALRRPPCTLGNSAFAPWRAGG